MSYESYAEQQFAAACRDPRFLARLNAFGTDRDQIVVVPASMPVGEALAQARSRGVLAVLDIFDNDGFVLVRVRMDA